MFYHFFLFHCKGARRLHILPFRTFCCEGRLPAFWTPVLVLFQERTRGRGQGKTEQCAQEGWTIGTGTVSVEAQMWQEGKASDFKELVGLAKKSTCGVHHGLHSPHLHLHFRLPHLLDCFCESWVDSPLPMTERLNFLPSLRDDSWFDLKEILKCFIQTTIW